MMTQRYRIALAVVAVVSLGVIAAAIAMSRNAPCRAAAPVPPGIERMQGVVQSCYGTGLALQLTEIARPVPADDQVLVKVYAAGMNPVDWHLLTGMPYVMRLSSGLGAPHDAAFGTDFAGVVSAVGAKVTKFKPGDKVFGSGGGALAEYMLARPARALARMPEGLSFEEAAAIPVSGITALQGLRDHGHLQAGDRVLINGASGGVGTFAVQIAKAFGAEVTGVAGPDNLVMVRALGADHVIDYTMTDYTLSGKHYDLVLDNVGNHPVLETRHVLNTDGRLVLISGPKKNPWLGPLTRAFETVLFAPFVSQEMNFFVANSNGPDLEVLSDLVRAGKLKPAIDRQYVLKDVAAAIDYVGTGQARAKVVVTIHAPTS